MRLATAATGVCVAAALLATGCAHRTGAGAGDAASELGPVVDEGWATFYDEKPGGPTASGERFDPRALTAAHRTLPFGTVVSVENTHNGRVVRVRINDRGPYGHDKKHHRVLDVSPAAARLLDMIDAGVIPVRLRVVRPRPSS